MGRMKKSGKLRLTGEADPEEGLREFTNKDLGIRFMDRNDEREFLRERMGNNARIQGAEDQETGETNLEWKTGGTQMVREETEETVYLRELQVNHLHDWFTYLKNRLSQ